MTTLSHEPSGVVQEPQGWSARLLVKEMWASIAIVAMWIAVAVSAAWGADFVASSSGGSDRTTIPVGIAVALFASIGTWAVAKYGFGDRRNDRG
jgi:hypothetical protein